MSHRCFQARPLLVLIAFFSIDPARALLTSIYRGAGCLASAVSLGTLYSRSIRNAVLGVAIVAMSSCGGKSNNNSSGSSPTAPTTPTIALAGSWSGTMSSTGSTPNRLTWAATQSGATVTGPAVLTITGRPVNGTLAGTISGTQMSLIFTLPAGSFTSIGGPSACSVTGTATSTPTTTSITATMTLTFHASCIGTVSEAATDTVQLSLTKQ